MRARRLLILVPVLLALCVTGAVAFWTATGSTSASASVGTLSAPTITDATPAGGATVSLTWSTVAPAEGGTVSYYVTRDGGTPAGDCATSAAPTAATSCTDSDLATGSHSYTVTAVWHSWTATSSASAVTVIPAAATHLVLAAATTTPAAGAADDLTITAKDAANDTVVGYTGDKNLTFGGAATAPDGTHPTVSDTTGAAKDFGATTTITFTSGVATISGASNGVMRLYEAGSATITVSDGSIGDSGLSVTVSPASAASLSMSNYPSPTVAGVSHALTVEALDAFGNTATGYAGTVAFSGSNDAQAVLPANSTLTSGTGSFNATFKTVAGGSKTLTATDTVASSITGSQSGITVTPASAATMSVSGYPSTTVAGVSHTFNVEALDAFGNPATGYAGTVAFSATNDAQAVLPANSTLTSGTGSFNATFKTVAGGSKTLTATDTVASSITGSQSGITVTPASAATTAITSGSGQSATVSTPFASALVASVSDAFGNAVAGINVTFAGPLSGASGTFASAGCTSSTPTSECVATTAANGRATSSTLTANATAGVYSVSASASGTNTASFSLTNVIGTFQVSVPGTPTAGNPFPVTITAKSGASTDTSYTGTKCLVFSGPGSSPSNTPPTYPVQGSCAVGASSVSFASGVATATVTLFRATASAALTVTQGAVIGTSAGFAVNSAGVALSYNRTCPVAVAKNSTTAFAINVPNDAWANPFTNATSIAAALTLSSAANFGFGTVGTGTATVNITTGPASNTFSVVESGANKSATITATAPTGFTAPPSCTINAGN